MGPVHSVALMFYLHKMYLLAPLLTAVSGRLSNRLHVQFLSLSGVSTSAGGAHGRRRAEEETAGALQQTRSCRLQPVHERPEPQRFRAARSLSILLASSQPPHRSESLLLSYTVNQSSGPKVLCVYIYQWYWVKTVCITSLCKQVQNQIKKIPFI